MDLGAISMWFGWDQGSASDSDGQIDGQEKGGNGNGIIVGAWAVDYGSGRLRCDGSDGVDTLLATLGGSLPTSK